MPTNSGVTVLNISFSFSPKRKHPKPKKEMSKLKINFMVSYYIFEFESGTFFPKQKFKFRKDHLNAS